MKIKFSISLKVTLIIILISSTILTSLSYINYDNQQKILETSIEAQTKFITSTLDVFATRTIVFDENDKINFSNNDETMTIIENLTDRYDEIINFDVVIYDFETSDFKIFASNNKSVIGTRPENIIEHQYVYWSDVKYDENGSIFIENKNKSNSIIIDLGAGKYRVVTPIVYGYGDNAIRIGTYEVDFLWKEEYDKIQQEILNILYVSFISTTALIAILLYLFNVIFVKPLKQFGTVAKDIGKGKLDIDLKLDSKDELNDLADAFNQMAKDLKESRTKIEEYTRILEKVLDRKDEFIGQLGHDLKNPLQPLVGLLPMLIREEKDPKIKETLEVMNNNVTYMHSLIVNTLNLARLRSETIEFDIVNVDLKREVDNIIASQALVLEKNVIEIENKIDENIIVKADKLRLSEIFKNLISNSIKYKSDKPQKITIDASVGNKLVTISFKDTGVGMVKDKIDRIFDEFYKADRFGSDERSSGLGLAICKRIVEKHGGHIWAESPGPGKGSTMHFTLKLAKDEKDETNKQE